MAYDNTLNGAGTAEALHAIGSTIGEIFASLGRVFVPARGTEARMRKMEALAAKSDAELAQMGLKRVDIARLVFRDGAFF